MAKNSGSGELFREIEHTGDVGIEIEADSRAELFRRAAVAIAQLMVDTAEVHVRETRELSVGAANDAELMHDALSALLRVFLIDGFIWSAVAVEDDGTGLKIHLSGEPFDPNRHEFHQEIKAVTYHQLSVSYGHGKWRATVIFDV